MIRRLWLVFAQSFIVVAAALYVYQQLRPAPLSFRDAAAKAVPAVANIYTAKILWREMSEGDRLFNATAEAWALI